MDPHHLPDADAAALRQRVKHLRHMAAVRDLVAEYEAEHGAFTEEERADMRRRFAESDARLAARRAVAVEARHTKAG
ncbi:MAG TPA: hypothetical protein VF228_22455 [Iamia sp.]